MGTHYDRLKRWYNNMPPLENDTRMAGMAVGLGLTAIADALETCFGEKEVPTYCMCPHCGRGYHRTEPGYTGEPFVCRCENWIKWTDGKLEDAS